MIRSAGLFVILVAVFAVSGCSQEEPSGGGTSSFAATPYDACVNHARADLRLPDDTVFAWGMHRETDVGLSPDSIGDDRQVIETWFVVPQNIGPPDSRTLRCVVLRDPSGQWRTSEYTTEKKVSPGLGRP